MQTISYSQQISLQKQMEPCLATFAPQSDAQHLQHYLRQLFYVCLPSHLRCGVAPDGFQVTGSRAVWQVYVQNNTLAHQLRFLAPELERRLRHHLWRDLSGQSALPAQVQAWLRHLPHFRLQIQVRAEYFYHDRLAHVPNPNPLLFQRSRWSEQEASAYLQAFWAKRFDEFT